MAMELKVWRGHPDPLAVGLQQLDDDVSSLSQSRSAVDRGWLVIFDQRRNQPEVRECTTVEREETPAGRSVILIWV